MNLNSQAPFQSFDSNEIFQTILEPARSGVWIFDLEGVTTYVNSTMAQMIGYTKDELIGKKIQELLDEERVQAAHQKLEQRKQGNSSVYTFRMKHKNGSDVWIVSNANPLRDQTGKIVGSIGFVTEIDAIHHTESHEKEIFQKFFTSKNKIIELENLTLNLDTFELRINQKQIDLSAFGLKLFKYFVENPNRMISRRELLEKVWEDTSLGDRIIDAHIVALRKKIRGFQGKIKTIYGVGYILRVNRKTS